jgi:hypothetical protein
MGHSLAEMGRKIALKSFLGLTQHFLGNKFVVAHFLNALTAKSRRNEMQQGDNPQGKKAAETQFQASRRVSHYDGPAGVLEHPLCHEMDCYRPHLNLRDSSQPEPQMR